MPRSTRHSKITGDFAELLVLYWLSKCGFECAKIDHTGIDLIASIGSVRLGISVQCRSRVLGKERDSVNLHPFEEARVPCEAFGLVPYSAIVVDRGDIVSCYLVALDYLETIAGGRTTRTWSMKEAFLQARHNDPKIAWFELTGSSNWRDGSEALKTLVEFSKHRIESTGRR
jgi:hypothetical protein